MTKLSSILRINSLQRGMDVMQRALEQDLKQQRSLVPIAMHLDKRLLTRYISEWRTEVVNSRMLREHRHSKTLSLKRAAFAQLTENKLNRFGKKLHMLSIVNFFSKKVEKYTQLMLSSGLVALPQVHPTLGSSVHRFDQTTSATSLQRPSDYVRAQELIVDVFRGYSNFSGGSLLCMAFKGWKHALEELRRGK